MDSKFKWTEIKVQRYAQFYCNNSKWFSYNATEKSTQTMEAFKEAYKFREVYNVNTDVSEALKTLKREGYKVSLSLSER
jgi:hypothetical protein|tara:strand:- start:94 stop:330 length:237 start_codon:yes stop_codon:yes gene_type:complete